MIPYWLKSFVGFPGNPQFNACACERWCRLVSNNPCFDDRFLRVQIDKQRVPNPRDFFTTSDHPWAPKRVLRGDRLQRNFSLSFLPCFQGPVKTIAEGGEPIVVAAHNGFLLCPGTRWVQQDYYICYPYTKQWDALPRPPQCTNKVIVGLMCNPYNNLGDRRVCEDQYRYRVVRIIIPDDDRDERYNSFLGQFKAEIFAAETRKWTERVVTDGFVIGLDPYSNDDNCITPPASLTTTAIGGCEDDGKNYINCHFIDKPEGEDAATSDLLGVCRWSSGPCMRTCQLAKDSSDSFRDLCVWDYEQDNQAAAGKYFWSLIGRVNLKTMVTLNPLSMKWTLDHRFYNGVRVLAFDPNDGYILYLELCQHIVMFDGAAGTLNEAWKTKVSYHNRAERDSVFPFVLPKWPTSVHGHKQREQASSSNSRLPH
ncbi:unnamed protein product [Malus baccata var. baccata]